MAFTWDDSLSVDEAAIDQQHQQMIHRVNSLLDAMKAGKGTEEIRRLLLFLEEYVVEHFRDEEACMRGCRYPEYEAHKAEHDAFVADFHRLKAEILDTNLAMPVLQMQRRVCDWLLHHIGKVDRSFGEYLKTRS